MSDSQNTHTHTRPLQSSETLWNTASVIISHTQRRYRPCFFLSHRLSINYLLFATCWLLLCPLLFVMAHTLSRLICSAAKPADAGLVKMTYIFHFSLSGCQEENVGCLIETWLEAMVTGICVFCTVINLLWTNLSSNSHFIWWSDFRTRLI